MDTMNKFMVGGNGGEVFIFRPPVSPFSQEDAILLAAWLVSMAGADKEKFNAVLAAIEGE